MASNHSLDIYKDEEGNVVYATDSLGNRIPVPAHQKAGPVKYIGFDRTNLPANPSREMLAEIGLKPRMHKYILVRTQFHGGGLISTHRSQEAAERARRKYRMSDCVCGCAVIVSREEYDNLRSSIDIQSPYAPAR